MSQASANRIEAQSLYRFWFNPRVKAPQRLASPRAGVRQQVRRHPVVLSLQDTTALNFGTNRNLNNRAR
ncbi:MAG: hypothetical protein KME45_33150 [Stenomitos rutilans HA7619-LM2]|nr:hypothetical protein [Stenomitos rutilans HA7619-LM2]